MPITSVFDVWRTKGLNKKIMKPVLKLQPDWFCLDGYYCLPGTDLFLCGFLMDHKPYGSEISVFSIPLFSREINLHLSYTDTIRSRDSIINRKGKTPTQIANEFIEIVNPLIGLARAKDSMDNYFETVESNELYRNTRIAYDYSLGLVLARRFEEAAKSFNQIASCEWENRVVPEEANSASHLFSLLEANAELAVQEVEMYLESNRRSLSEFLT